MIQNAHICITAGPGLLKRPTDVGIYHIIDSMHDRASAQFLWHHSDSFAHCGFPCGTILNLHIVAYVSCKCTLQITLKTQNSLWQCASSVYCKPCYWLTWESEDGSLWQWGGDRWALDSTAVLIDMLAHILVFTKNSHHHTKWQWEPYDSQSWQ